jgi:hypothetical protein
MPYHEMDEHEKECLNAFCDRTGSNAMQPTPLNQGLSSDCYTLVITKLCPSTNINNSINNNEAKKKIHDKKSSTVWHNQHRKIMIPLICLLSSVNG